VVEATRRRRIAEMRGRQRAAWLRRQGREAEDQRVAAEVVDS
jgi:hypothetical protein